MRRGLTGIIETGRRGHTSQYACGTHKHKSPDAGTDCRFGDIPCQLHVHALKLGVVTGGPDPKHMSSRGKVNDSITSLQPGTEPIAPEIATQDRHDPPAGRLGRSEKFPPDESRRTRDGQRCHRVPSGDWAARQPSISDA